jgi:Yip1 domain
MMTALQQSFWDRLVGVVTLQRSTYEAIQRDPEATGQAWLIVILLGLANGISWIIVGTAGVPPELARAAPELVAVLKFESNERRLLALALGIVAGIVFWYISAWLLRAVGTRMAGLTGSQITQEQMRRLVAWGSVPSLASFLSPLPIVGPLLATLGSLWSFVTGVMAVRTAFDVGIGKAIAIEIIAFLIVFVLLVLAFLIIAIMLAWSLA